MLFLKKEPCRELSGIIKSFWMMDSGDETAIKEEKIIPDGYPEMIFHYKDPYFIDIEGQWEKQDSCLLAGQIRNHFYLRNSGKSGILAIKLQPSAPSFLFNLDMSDLTNKVITIGPNIRDIINPLITTAISDHSFENKVNVIEQWFINYLKSSPFSTTSEDDIIKLIIEQRGQVILEDACADHGITMRNLERYFKKRVGLSPKFYTRITRFSHIFQLVQNNDFDWSDISFLAGYYDQSHFIKNFKEFTGENPTSYGFDSRNMANFFLKN